ncbi:Glycoside hydrolase, family 28 [Cynara cardunculus var. scolymus]|uniref:Glycoside hydrolase, family 28 n=1 Tax=Cynara cardunculus var. scolymus TaxID=59895 RepID=A0A103Y6Q0_CYNCS|nr:Glycoside hydrolase, family 28 [Cynara cardunculus var. scolymus]
MAISFHSFCIQSSTMIFILWSIIIQSESYTSSSIRLPRSQSRSPPVTIFVTEYGATGDGVHYDTGPIQSAIDACSLAGGGRVVFPPGNYLTATVFLKSRVVLEVQKNATVLGGTRLEDYPAEQSRWYVVVAEDAEDVGITGGGEINGQGLEFVVKFDERKNVMVSWNQTGACTGDECRPRLVGFIRSKNVRVWDIHLTEPAYWWMFLHLVQCDNTYIHDMSIYGDFNTPNNDGIDIDDSNNTVITRCSINTGDDAICPKTYDGPLYNLTATDSWIRTKSSAIKFGSASWFEFKDLLFNNITIVDSHRGLGLQIRDGGNVRDVTFSNINITTRYYDPSWWGRAEPIYVTTCPRDDTSKTGTISNLLFVNITATSENGIFLSGSKNGNLRNLKFLNVNLNYKRWTNYADGLVDYRPGCQGLVNRSSAGIMMEHIEGLEVKNVNMRWLGDRVRRWNNPLEFRPSNVDNVSLLNFHSGSYDE